MFSYHFQFHFTRDFYVSIGLKASQPQQGSEREHIEVRERRAEAKISRRDDRNL
jgi:hypothetical protein